MKLIKAMWDKLDPKTKDAYEERYKKGREKYIKDMNAWNEEQDEEEKRERSSNKPVTSAEKVMGAKPKKVEKVEEQTKSESPERKSFKSKGNAKN